MKRYLIVISNEGMDAATQIADNPEAAVEASKNLKVEDFNNQAEIILIFEHKLTERPSKSQIEERSKTLHAKALVTAGGSGSSPNEYWGVEMRRKITNGILIQIALEESWFKKFRNMNSYKSAFYLLDIMINSFTKYGRFGEKDKTTIKGQNVLKDKSEELNKKYKRLRREMLSHLESEKEDSDII
jgi:hypothetical protein